MYNMHHTYIKLNFILKLNHIDSVHMEENKDKTHTELEKI